MSLGETSDEELVLKAGRGDRAAFGVLVRRHHGRMLRLAWRFVGDSSRAEDIVQETFTRAWVKAPEWRSIAQGGAGQFTTWLTKIALNLAIDARRRVVPLRLEAADDIASSDPTADVRLEQSERQAAVARAIAGLPERQRAAIILTYHEGLSNAEAAQALETTVGALELLLVRARRNLRDSLQHFLRDET